MAPSSRPTGNRRRHRAARLASLAVGALVVALYILVLTRGHVPAHLPFLSG